MPLGKKKKQNTMGLMALAGETAKMAQNMMVLNKTEAELEKEMEKEEKRVKPKSKIGKVRRRGEHLLHGKYLLLMVVILNVIDCVLVLGELMLDIKYVTELLTKEYERSDNFVDSMRGLYPNELKYADTIQIIEFELLRATISWDLYDGSHDAYIGNSNSNNNSSTDSDPEKHLEGEKPTTIDPSNVPNQSRRRRAAVTPSAVSNDPGDHGNSTTRVDPYAGMHEDHHNQHSIEEDVAHGLHKASITILGILVVETFVKIFCLGRQMLEHKIECFDSFIVIASFIVDLVLIKGLQQFTVQEFVLILAFLVPWRIIRVVNSLVVAIMDHEHFRLVLLYKQKKKVSLELKEAKDEIKGLEACIGALGKLCTQAGITDTLVKSKLNMYRKVKAKTNAMGALGTFAIGGDAMSKPFAIGPANSSVTKDVVINVEGLENGKKDVHSPPNGNVPLNTTGAAHLMDKDEWLERPRSRSALEARETKSSDLVKMLAENSATFIATINKDEAELRARIEKMERTLQQKKETEDTEKDKFEIPKSYDADTDQDGLVVTGKDDNDDIDGFDNPATHL